MMVSQDTVSHTPVDRYQHSGKPDAYTLALLKLECGSSKLVQNNGTKSTVTQLRRP
jgi:hypothetical protein